MDCVCCLIGTPVCFHGSGGDDCGTRLPVRFKHMSAGVSVHDCSMWVQTEQDASPKPHSLKNYSTKQKPSAEKYQSIVWFYINRYQLSVIYLNERYSADLENKREREKYIQIISRRLKARGYNLCSPLSQHPSLIYVCSDQYWNPQLSFSKQPLMDGNWAEIN